MQAAQKRGRKKTPSDGAVAPLLQLAAASSPAEREFARARQDFLDALPITAFLACRGEGGEVYVQIANDHFRRISVGAEPPPPISLQNVPLLALSGIAGRIDTFLKTKQKILEFEATDGRDVGGRVFAVRLARMDFLPSLGERCVVSIIDKTAQVETEKSLRSEMLRDSLTGLPNRTAFNGEIEEILHRADFREGNYAVLVVDLTRFSRVNECMGAIAGDELLITFARRPISALRPGDMLARTGGDEFGILVRLDKGIEDALQVGKRIKTVLAAPFRLSELEIRVDCSIGCALVTRNVELADEVLRNAQFAVKRAKETGHVQVYEPSQAKAVRRRFSIETELRRAIEKDELTLAFQPLIDLATERIAGFEALARWDHKDRGAISPTEFIPVAEESGLILDLGRWALDAAARTLGSWDANLGRTLPLYMSVNVSAIQIARDEVAAAVDEALRAGGISGDRLTLELTESAIVQDPGRATDVLERLRGLDARIAMDDFGTGYTSLAYLQRLPIDMLKIDRSFVTGMLADRDSVAIVRAVLSLANALGMSTTAEGIDAAELARALTVLGCTHGQGFYFGKPLPADEALDYWISRSA